MSDSRGLYAAFTAKDARFDGRFFVGVSSTGIYCRPVCRAKRPRAENCEFYSTAAEAEQAGYRPCLLCRPEIAPGASTTDAVSALAGRAARMLEENCGSGQSLDEIAARLGCTGRHLRRVFAAEFNVSPVRYLQTCRLLLAKNLLTDTDLSVLEIAMAAGFGSLRRFNDLFRKQYRLAPTALRKEALEGKKRQSGITLSLGYRPPYRWREMLDFLALRAIPGVETAENGEYRRTARFVTADGKTLYGCIRVEPHPGKNALRVTPDAALLPVLPQVLARVRHLFDLYCDPDAVYGTLASMNTLRPGICVLGTRIPGSFDAFEMSVRAVLGQQITVKAARTLAARFVEAFGRPVRTETEGLNRVFPAPEDIAALEGPVGDLLGPLGITSMRAKAILELARMLTRGETDLTPGADPEDAARKLRSLPGIGDWTARYILMRTLGWPDIFLETDMGVKKALAPRSPAEIRAMAETWSPYRSYATVSLWNSL